MDRMTEEQLTDLRKISMRVDGAPDRKVKWLEHEIRASWKECAEAYDANLTTVLSWLRSGRTSIAVREEHENEIYQYLVDTGFPAIAELKEEISALKTQVEELEKPNIHADARTGRGK